VGTVALATCECLRSLAPNLPPNSTHGIPNCSDNRLTASTGTPLRSSGTNPSHSSVHNCTDAPSTFPRPRNQRTKASSVEGSVKYRISSDGAQIGKTPQLRQLLIGKRVTSRHKKIRSDQSPFKPQARYATAPTKALTTQRERPDLQVSPDRCFCAGNYWEAHYEVRRSAGRRANSPRPQGCLPGSTTAVSVSRNVAKPTSMPGALTGLATAK